MKPKRKSIQVFDGMDFDDGEDAPLFSDINFKLDRVIIDHPNSKFLGLLAQGAEPDEHGTRLRHYPDYLGLKDHWPEPDELISVTIKRVEKNKTDKRITQVVLHFEIQL